VTTLVVVNVKSGLMLMMKKANTNDTSRVYIVDVYIDLEVYLRYVHLLFLSVI